MAKAIITMGDEVQTLEGSRLMVQTVAESVVNAHDSYGDRVECLTVESADFSHDIWAIYTDTCTITVRIDY